ncbi:MAG: flagellar biosynthesis protein FlhA [Proteobacteria bacterium]|jgi:flagellar biosynthesis protein FlhA|nr:flagellar biosynthesis protein FlhA [Pseudomonadota bacterium]NBT93651.1 flagellar biosynthesis protein FlhA [Chloroflexota bacterium]NBQ31226.1 flagellar biosynthesis protein FlhA [Pseudomonadota bacterium]NBQ61296.1 flagellar biosynthesis protein FlhA [Pseudomonadota bacterium]NBT02842.1 flagellar biosynthesis protein FlhA [Pseudomonadota bacterium]
MATATTTLTNGNGGATQASGWQRLLQQRDVLLPVAVVAVISMMIVPLPTVMLDLLLIVNLSIGLLILLVSMYTTEPLAFSVFPTLLLITTLFRLALNISASRLILLNAFAGHVIEAFGSVVIGGSYVVGIVVFIILVVIQFVVITNGAGRVAEVAARFTLDAMPGKQMSIDADLNAGLITEAEAKRRRQKIEQEADFYGAMDGASKFVRGDAIAGIIIILVNILAGFVIGVMQQGMSLMGALQTYALLTVGDGLVSQIPALMISTATGIVVTRAATSGDLGTDTIRQITSNPRVLGIVTGALIVLAFVPGIPKLPFFIIACLTGVGAYMAWQSEASGERTAISGGATVVETTATGEPAPTGPEAVTPLLALDPMELEIGYGLIPLVDPQEAGNLLDRITRIRRQMALDLGIVLPTVRVRDNLQLQPNQYVVKLRGVEVARGDLLINQYLAMNAGLADEQIEGIPTTEPAFGLPALWIQASLKDRAELLGYTVVDPPSVLTTHLTEVIKGNAANILSRQDVQTLITNLKAEHPAVVDELIPGVLSIGETQKVLQNLLRERITIRDLVTIVETLADYARQTRDTEALTEYVRQRLARAISAQYRGADGLVHVITLSPRVEQQLTEALKQTDQGTMIAMEPVRAQQLLQRLAGEMERVAGLGHAPVLLCSARLRLAVRRLTERVLPNLVVLSFSEIATGVDVQAEGMVIVD